MSDGSSTSSPQRPATARPRRAEQDEHSTPPTTAELEAIERHHTELARQAGADVADDADLGLVLVTSPGRGPALNYAARIRWPAAEFDERLARAVAHLRELGQWPVVKVSEGLAEPADLAERLAAAGWARIGGERIMWTRHPPTVPHIDPGLRVEAVTSTTALDCVRLETTNFGLPADALAERADRLAGLVEAGSVRAFVLRLAREPVASARLESGPTGVAGLSAIGVAARHRRRGYGAMVTAVATRAGLATGHKLVWLSVEEDNVAAVKLYSGLGFQPSFAWSRWAASSG